MDKNLPNFEGKKSVNYTICILYCCFDTYSDLFCRILPHLNKNKCFALLTLYKTQLQTYEITKSIAKAAWFNLTYIPDVHTTKPVRDAYFDESSD